MKNIMLHIDDMTDIMLSIKDMTNTNKRFIKQKKNFQNINGNRVIILDRIAVGNELNKDGLVKTYYWNFHP